MIPFLKDKKEGVMAARDEDESTMSRKPDYEDDSDDPMLDAIAEDILTAVNKKDKGLMKESLDALCEYLRDELEGPEEEEEGEQHVFGDNI